MGPRTERSSSPIPSGAYAANSARWSFENSLRSARFPLTARWTWPVEGVPFIEPEQTNPPGDASTSIAERRRSPDRLGQLRRDHRTQLHDRVVPLLLRSPRTHDEAALVEGELRRIEEEHLADLRLQWVEAERLNGRALVLLGNGQLQLDAVGALDQLVELLRLFGAQYGAWRRSGCCHPVHPFREKVQLRMSGDTGGRVVQCG